MALAVPYLVKTKLSPPQPSDDVIARPRLIARLRRNPSRSLTLVCAQAGAGKSTLLAQWLRDEQRPVAWLSLESSESELAPFVAYLLAAVQSVYPEACPALTNLTGDGSPLVLDQIISPLINDLADLPGDLVLVLEDYHVIHAPEIHQALIRLLERRPPHLHLVISTRTEPPLMLNSLRAAGQLTEIRQRDLRFDRSEIAEFLDHALEEAASPATLETLALRTEGWGAGLRLAVLSVQTGDALESLAAGLRGTQRHVAGYLTDEVLTRLTAETKRFLLRTSILERFCAPLCDALLDEAEGGHAEALIQQLEAANLFLMPLDGERRWYRYHHLFRDLLAAHLQDDSSATNLRDLHGRAGRWLAEQGLVDEALRHLLAGGDVESVADLVERSTTSALNQHELFRLQGWLALLPADVIARRAGLLLARAWTEYYGQREIAIVATVERARELLLVAPAESKTLHHAQLNVLDALIAYNQIDGEASMKCGLAALAELPEQETFLRSIGFVCAYVGMYMSGHVSAASAGCERALAQLPDMLDAYGIRVLMAAGHLPMNQAHFERLYQVGMRMLSQAQRHHMLLGIVWGRYMAGVAGLARCQYEEALRHFEEVVRVPFSHYARPALNARVGLVVVYEALGRREEADAAAAEALLAAQSQVPSAVLAVTAVQAHCALARNELRRARQLIPAEPGWDARWHISYAVQLPELVSVRVLIANGGSEGLAQAATLLESVLAAVRQIHCVRFEIESLLLKALLYQRRGQTDSALKLLEESLCLAEPGGGTRPFVESGAPLAPLMRQLRARNAAPSLLPQLLAGFAEEARPMPAQRSQLIEPLTNRELDVLQLLAKRLSNKEIAEALVVAPNTVRTHLNHLFDKLGVSGRRDAVIEARELGIIP